MIDSDEFWDTTAIVTHSHSALYFTAVRGIPETMRFRQTPLDQVPERSMNRINWRPNVEVGGSPETHRLRLRGRRSLLPLEEKVRHHPRFDREGWTNQAKLHLEGTLLS